MGTTTSRRYPYPEPTDKVGNGGAAIRALAERVDTDHALSANTVVGDWMSSVDGWALVNGEVVTYGGITHLRLTVRRTGDALWIDQSGTVPEPAGHHIGTIKTGTYDTARPCPLTWPAFTAGPRAHNTNAAPRGGRGVINAAGQMYLHGVDATDALSINRNDTVSITATYPNRTAFTG